MKNNIFEIFKISGEGLSFQRQRLSSIAKNIANANTTKTANGGPYQREIVIAKSVARSPFESEFRRLLPLEISTISNIQQSSAAGEMEGEYLQSETIVDDAPPRLVYDPSHPDADENGYVRFPNVNVITEMVEMISAQRAFEANVSLIEAAKNVARDSMDI